MTLKPKAMANKIRLLVLLVVFTGSTGNAQYEIAPVAGYSTQIGTLVAMLEDLKNRIAEQVGDLDQSQTDFLFDDKANSIGSLVMHLVATEAYYQVETLENRQFTAEEETLWSTAGGLGDASRSALKDKPIRYYLDLWDKVREKTLTGQKQKTILGLNRT